MRKGYCFVEQDPKVPIRHENIYSSGVFTMGLLDFSCKYLTYAFVSNDIWFKENSMIKADIEGYIVPNYCF